MCSFIITASEKSLVYWIYSLFFYNIFQKIFLIHLFSMSVRHIHTQDIQERDSMIEKVRQRYNSYNFFCLIYYRISELDAQFADLQVKEQQWPLPGPDVTPMYKKYLTHTYKLGQNIVCAFCGCISHDITEFEIVLDSYGPLRHLRISEDVDIPFDFSCGIDVLNQNCVVIDKLGITQDKRIYLCRICHNQLSKAHQPSEALANFRWIGPVPEELRDLTWIEQLLIARVHVCGSIIRLGQRNNWQWYPLWAARDDLTS